METVFLVCAALGGTVLVCQFVLTLIGFGADDVDVPGHIPDVGGAGFGDIGHVGGDMGHMGGDIGHVGHAGGGLAHGHAGDSAAADHHGHTSSHGSTWLFGVISFRTAVAAVTFFGLCGYAALEGGQGTTTSLGVAIVAGGAAMYGVHWLMGLMYRLGQDRTLRITQSVGERGTVYVPIPGQNAGEGKVQISMEDRLVEYAAVTREPEELPTGTSVVVTRVISPAVLEVASVRKTPEEAAT